MANPRPGRPAVEAVLGEVDAAVREQRDRDHGGRILFAVARRRPDENFV